MHADPAPGLAVYMMDEVAREAVSSAELSASIAELLSKRITHTSPIVKFKVRPGAAARRDASPLPLVSITLPRLVTPPCRCAVW